MFFTLKKRVSCEFFASSISGMLAPFTSRTADFEPLPRLTLVSSF
jgi:hypothetical protein